MLRDHIARAAIKSYIQLRPWKTAGAYEVHVWAYMREYFTGGVDAFGFIDLMANEIDNQMGRAWREGAAEMGVYPEDFEQDDDDIIAAMIGNEQNYLDGIAGDIEEFIADGGHTDAEFSARFRHRAALWANGYNSARAQAQLHFGGKAKLKWVMGATEEHCETCAGLNGIVAWAREWDEAGVLPQGSMLACGGWRCDCALEKTNERRSSGALDRIMTVMVSSHV